MKFDVVICVTSLRDAVGWTKFASYPHTDTRYPNPDTRL
jgi:hypothetical protein